jgi:hypothetical protein
MAGVKGRSGRKKKAVKAKPQRSQRVEVLRPAPKLELPPVEIKPEPTAVENPEPTILEKMRAKLTNLLPAGSPTPKDSSESTEADTHEPAQSSTPEFEVVAAKLEDKYDAGASGESAPPPNSSAPSPGVGNVVSPATVESFLMMIFNGVAKVHGDQWKLTETDKAVLVPSNVAMIDEQAPRWFADSENKALWVWTFVMLFFIMSRSKAGARLVEWATQKVDSMVSRAGGSTKTA